MRRPYTLDDYRRLVDGIVERLPHASIGSDMIVGFPGRDRRRLRRERATTCRPHRCRTCTCSRTPIVPGTEAVGDGATRARRRRSATRGARLREIGADLARRFRRGRSGTVRPGLTLEDGTLVVTDNYLKVRVPPGHARNERVRVRIDEAGGVVTGTIV